MKFHIGLLCRNADDGTFDFDDIVESNEPEQQNLGVVSSLLE
jgi:hypothetical protein